MKILSKRRFMLSRGLFFGVFALFFLTMSANRLRADDATPTPPTSLTAPTENRTDAPGLLVLTHGSPSPAWNVAVNDLVERLRKLNEVKRTFHAIEGANLEFCRPDAASGIETLEKAGCNRIIVVPAFVFPTSHSHFDVPSVLGIYSSPSSRETLRTENARVASPSVPITVTQTLSEGDLLEKFVSDETATLVKNPSDEVLLLIAHGDEGHEGLINPVMKRLVTKTCGEYGLAEGDWAYCEVGQSYGKTVLPLIHRYSEQGLRVLVVGLYLATSAQKIDETGRRFGSQKMDAPEGPPSENGAFSRHGIIRHPYAAEFILKTAADAVAPVGESAGDRREEETGDRG